LAERSKHKTLSQYQNGLGLDLAHGHAKLSIELSETLWKRGWQRYLKGEYNDNTG